VWDSLLFLSLWFYKKSVVFFTSLVLVIQSRKQVWPSLRFLFLWSIKETSVVFFTILVPVVYHENKCCILYQSCSCDSIKKLVWTSLFFFYFRSIKKTSVVFFTSSVLLVLSIGDIVVLSRKQVWSSLLFLFCWFSQ
jgi:hypothetical protein